MKLKETIIILAVCLAIFGLFVLGYANSGSSAASVQGVPANAPASALAASSTFYDFGTISMRNGDVSRDFTFTNPANHDVTITQVETSCMCTSALLVEPDGSTKGPFGMPGMGGMNATDETIKAGVTRTLRVIFNPAAHGPAGVGSIDRFILLTDASGGALKFEIKAIVTP
ncbi:MAG: DUF1573 domain-containing protein [Patescibacteria group bacterium]|nr:DUF1573 domain-containing protein [Patescibacteria group bacterium]MDE1946074.1 DUF1573 domain-containing protein [Patescibacteria group bacterium]